MRSNNFDALRLFGALLVLYSHQFAVSARPEPEVLPGIYFGGLGVQMFFAISGYLVCNSWLSDPNAHRFIERRFLRIWPAYAAAIILTMAATCLALNLPLWQFLAYLRNIVCLQCYDPAVFKGQPFQTVYGSMWTIPLEVACYGLLLAAGLLFRDRFRHFADALAWVILAVYLLPDVVNAPGWHWPVGSIGVTFLAGCLIRLHPQLLQRPWLPALGGAALILHGNYSEALAFVVPITCVWIGVRSWPILRSAGRFGDLSYGIYLYAWIVQQLGVYWLGKETSVWTLMLATVVCSTLLAFVSWHLIEKRALRLKPTTPSPIAPVPQTVRLGAP